MDNSRKLIVGYDLCEDFSQINCYSYKSYKPIPIRYSENEETPLIPTVLCEKADSRTWVFGKDAIECSKDGSGILVDNLLHKLKNREGMTIYGQKYSAVSLIEKYLRKTLTLIKNYFPTEAITKIVITLRDMDPHIIEGVYEALYMLGIERDRASIISHGSSFMYYALSQEKELWLNDVGLFDFNENGLSFYQISIKRRANPMIAGMEKRDFSDTLNYSILKNKKVDIEYAFESIANMVLFKQIISTLYFTGRGFENNWAEEIIKSLCAGRRVFLGQNLYAMGACYAAKELSGDKNLENIILLNDQMIVCDIGIKVYVDGLTQEVVLVNAAVPWYEVDKDIDVIPDDASDIEIIIRNIMTKEIIRERIPLHNLPDRPIRMTRLNIKVTCLEKNKLKVVISDLGFGDIYPAIGKLSEYLLDI